MKTLTKQLNRTTQRARIKRAVSRTIDAVDDLLNDIDDAIDAGDTHSKLDLLKVTSERAYDDMDRKCALLAMTSEPLSVSLAPAIVDNDIAALAPPKFS